MYAYVGVLCRHANHRFEIIMRPVSETEFDDILQSAEAENALREGMGLPRFEVTTQSYPSVSGGADLLMYYFADMLFGFVQDGEHFSCGL